MLFYSCLPSSTGRSPFLDSPPSIRWLNHLQVPPHFLSSEIPFRAAEGCGRKAGASILYRVSSAPHRERRGHSHARPPSWAELHSRAQFGHARTPAVLRISSRSMAVFFFCGRPRAVTPTGHYPVNRTQHLCADHSPVRRSSSVFANYRNSRVSEHRARNWRATTWSPEPFRVCCLVDLRKPPTVAIADRRHPPLASIPIGSF